MKLTIAKITWFVCIGALAALCISAINYKKDGTLTAVEVRIEQFDSGAFFLTENDVLDEVMDIIVAPEDHLIKEIETGEIETALHTNPFVQDVDVYVSSDGILNVTLRQREPILRVFDAHGETYYVDREGLRIPVSNYFTARVPIATGHINVTQYDRESGDVETDWTRLHRLILAIDGDPFFKSLTEQIDVSKSGQITIIPATGDIKIIFGRAENINEKLKKLKAIYKQLFQEGGWDTYETINLTYSGQVVCKKKPNRKL
jgi:cell division protein FtsQ